MMDQLYASQTTTGQPAKAIAVSALSPTTPEVISQDASPKHASSFAGQLETTQANDLKASTPQQETKSSEATPEKEPEFGFLDFLDIINPLQHIPIVSSIYREITGDEIQPTARVFGGILFGGPSGFVSAIANSIVEETTGKDIGANVFEAFLGSDETESPVQVAEGTITEGKTASTGSNTPAAKADITDIFAQMSPTPPAAPIHAHSTISPPASQNIDVAEKASPNTPLEGKAALAALYSDLGSLKTKANQDLATQSIQVAEASIQKNVPPTHIPNPQGSGKPGKWFPLSGSNVIIAQTSAAPPSRPAPAPLAASLQPTQKLAAVNEPPVNQAVNQAVNQTANENDFAQQLLTGLDKYQELKKP